MQDFMRSNTTFQSMDGCVAYLLVRARRATFGSVSYAGTSSHYFCHVSNVSETAEGVLKQILLFPSLPQIWSLADSVGAMGW